MTALVNPFWYTAAAATDPNFASVVLLLHFDGANGATSFIDSSLAAHTVTGSASDALTTAQQKFGTASLNPTSLGASSADSADWAFGAGRFTIEAWVRATTAPSGFAGIVAQYGSSIGWYLGFNGGSAVFYYSANGATPLLGVSALYTFTLNTWVHIAVDRDASNVVRVYADGAVIGSATIATTFFDATNALVIGNDGLASAGRRWLGQIDEVRITKGVARYAGAFTPPTAPFPDS
jgi:hypothetical protein